MPTESDPTSGQFEIKPAGPITVFFPKHETFLLNIEGLPTFNTDDLRALFAVLATWPPLTPEQVVELHEALATFSSQMATASPGSSGDMEVVRAADELWLTLRALHIGLPQPPPRQEANLGGVACLDERRMGPPPPLGAYTGPPVEMVPIPAYSGPEPVEVPLSHEEVKHNCWTCNHNLQSGAYRVIEQHQESQRTWRWVLEQIPEGCNMPPKDADGCPGWEQK